MKPSPKLDLVICFGFVAIIYTSCQYFLPKQKPATTQDINCRALVRDGVNAKNQADFDYAKQNFNQQCNAWTDPHDK